jgi:hypothetical protein
VGAGQVAAIFAEIMREKLGCEQIESLNEWRLFEWIEGRTIQSLAGSKITDFTPI